MGICQNPMLKSRVHCVSWQEPHLWSKVSGSWLVIGHIPLFCTWPCPLAVDGWVIIVQRPLASKLIHYHERIASLGPSFRLGICFCSFTSFCVTCAASSLSTPIPSLPSPWVFTSHLPVLSASAAMVLRSHAPRRRDRLSPRPGGSIFHSRY